MNYIHCTQKVLKELKTPVMDLKEIIPDNSGPGNWYCNIFTFNRRKCLIFTSELTLYTFFIYGVTKKDMASLTDLFREHLTKNLEQSGIEVRVIDKILNEYRDIVFCKTANRSVLGSMNDFIYLFKARMESVDEVTEKQILTANIAANDTPMSAIKSVFPVRALKELIDEKYK